MLLCLGPGLGAGTLADGDVVRGGRGLAGEVAHLLTTGPDQQAMPLQAVFRVLGLLVADRAAIDVEAVRTLVADGPGSTDGDAVVAAVAGACRSIAALVSPDLVLLGGPWGRDDGSATRVRAILTGVT